MNNRHQFVDYQLMSHLPWCAPPVDNLPECKRLNQRYPRYKYFNGNPSGMTPCNCDTETGFSTNPNTTSVWLYYHNNLGLNDVQI